MKPNNTTIQIHSYALTGPKAELTIHRALAILRPYLPACIPLYRRLQFGRFFPDTQLLTNLPYLDASPDPQDGTVGTPWLMAFIDRTCRPETELWMFASWEASSSPSSTTTTSPKEEDALLYALFREIKHLPVPTSIHQETLLSNDDEQDHSGTSRKDYSAHMLSTSVLLCGAIHEKSIPVFERTNLIKHVFVAGSVPNHEYIFNLDQPPMSELLSKETLLPQDLRWGELQYKHFALVRSRTQIPRQDRTLAELPNTAIFPITTPDADPEPVAWAFVGLDGSLTTLHVEPERRGRGLAKQIATKLFRDKMDIFWEDGMPRLAHDYVIKGNTASVGVSESIGGRSEWDAHWVRVDLDMIED